MNMFWFVPSTKNTIITLQCIRLIQKNIDVYLDKQFNISMQYIRRIKKQKNNDMHLDKLRAIRGSEISQQQRGHGGPGALVMISN